MDLDDLIAAELSAQVVEEISAALELGTAEEPRERRAASRKQIRRCMAVVPYDPRVPDVTPLQVWVSAVSSSGIGIIHAEPMLTGDQFVVRLPLLGKEKVSMLCRVVRCTRETSGLYDGLYSIGGRFVRSLLGDLRASRRDARSRPGSTFWPRRA